MSEKDPRVDEILAPHLELIRNTPALTSILYDLDFLPEQCRSEIGARHLAGFCILWRKAFPKNEEGVMPLDTMIKLWNGISVLHGEEIVAGRDIRRNDKLKAKSDMVGAALVHYKIELER